MSWIWILSSLFYIHDGHRFQIFGKFEYIFLHMYKRVRLRIHLRSAFTLFDWKPDFSVVFYSFINFLAFWSSYKMCFFHLKKLKSTTLRLEQKQSCFWKHRNISNNATVSDFLFFFYFLFCFKHEKLAISRWFWGADQKS